MSLNEPGFTECHKIGIKPMAPFRRVIKRRDDIGQYCKHVSNNGYSGWSSKCAGKGEAILRTSSVMARTCSFRSSSEKKVRPSRFMGPMVSRASGVKMWVGDFRLCGRKDDSPPSRLLGGC